MMSLFLHVPILATESKGAQGVCGGCVSVYTRLIGTGGVRTSEL